MLLLNTLTPSNVTVFLASILSVMRMNLGNSDHSVNTILEKAGYSETFISANISITLTVLLTLISVCAIAAVIVRKQFKMAPRLDLFLRSFITFACFFFSFCLLEIYICALIDIKTTGNAFAWLVLILVKVPFGYTVFYSWKFDQRFTIETTIKNVTPVGRKTDLEAI